MPKKGQKVGRITDKERARVIEVFIADPKKSTLEIERETGVSKSSVDRILKKDLGDLGKSGESDVIARIIDQDKKILERGTYLANLIIEQTIEAAESDIKDPLRRPGSMVLPRIASVLSDSTKRHQLLTGQATENIQTLEELNDEQRERILRRRGSRTVGEGEPD